MKSSRISRNVDISCLQIVTLDRIFSTENIYHEYNQPNFSFPFLFFFSSSSISISPRRPSLSGTKTGQLLIGIESVRCGMLEELLRKQFSRQVWWHGIW